MALPHRSLVPTSIFLAASLLAGGCAAETTTPAIAFSDHFGDSAFEGFLNEELERIRPERGLRLRVVGADAVFRGTGGSTLSAEVRRATTLANDPDVVVAVGPGGSREALQVAPVYRDAELAQLVPTATSRLLGAAGPHVFLMAANDSVQGEFIGAFADTALHARSVVIIHVPDEYGIGLASGTAAALSTRRIALTDRIPMRLVLDCASPPDAAAHEAIADEVALRGTPDVAVLAVRSAEAGCLTRVLRARFPAIRLIAGDGTDFEPAFRDRAAAAAEGTYMVAYWHAQIDRPGAPEFVRRFEERVGRAARNSDAMFFDAVMLAGSAVRAAGPHRGRVQAYLRELGSARPAFEGITGPISFAPDARHTLLMTHVTNGRSELVR